MRDVAIVSFAQLPIQSAYEDRNEIELVAPVICEAVDAIGIDRREIEFTCSGSCDYLVGRPFSFVAAVDGIGAWPPIEESHLEMDGAWAVYEAWIRLQHGDIDSALVYAFGQASLGHLNEVLVQQLDPYYLAPLGPDHVSLAALQARALMDAKMCDETMLADVVARNRRAGISNPFAQIREDLSTTAFLNEPTSIAPLRAADCSPVSDGAAAMVLMAGDRARAVCENPVWIRGMDHRVEAHHLGMRHLTDLPSLRAASVKANVDTSRVELAELHSAFSYQEILLKQVLGLGENVQINPSGGPLCGDPTMVTGLTRIGEAAQRLMRGDARYGLAHAASGPCLQQNLICTLEVL
jgi:acetyl-CoA acetyltransferase